MSERELPPSPERRSIPPVALEDAQLAGRLLTLAYGCQEVAPYLPVGRVPWDRLAELADMLEAAAEDVRSLVERTAPRHVLRRSDLQV